MISLKGFKNQYFTTINHTGNNSSNDYVITHNLGTKNIEVDMWDPAEEAQIISVYEGAGAQVYGFVVLNLELNSCTIRIWQWQYTPGSLHTSNKTVEVTVTAV